MKKEIFMREFQDLEKRFSAMEPELAVTLKDDALGVEGYIVVWNTDISAGGPLAKSGKGGTRITPTVSLDEIKMLARIMALKNAAAGLPMGGAKSGVKANPDAPDFEKKYRRFAQLAKPYLLENGGPCAGFGFDIGARPVHPIWICDELKSTRSFTGKPIHMGGTDYDKNGIAGLGVSVAAKTLLEFENIDPHKTSFAVQGLGAMGAAVVRYFTEMGGKLHAISDPKYGGTYIFDHAIPTDLLTAIIDQDVDSVRRHLAEGHFKKLPPDDILYVEADILFPCAVHNVITRDNVSKVNARFVVEGANNPITDEARTILYTHNVTVIPDFIANSGGIIAAYVELTSKVTPEENLATSAKVHEAKETTIHRIAENVRTVLTLAKDTGVEPVIAAKYFAYKSIFDGLQSRKSVA